MGISLGNRLHSVDMSYGRFSFGLRKDIASSIDEGLGEEYGKWLESGLRHEDYDYHYLNWLIEDINLDEEIGYFLFEASDCEGSLTPKCCKKILVTFDKIKTEGYGYVGPNGNTATHEDIKMILEECAKNRWKLIWY